MGTDCGIAIVSINEGYFKTESLDRYRVLQEAYTDKKLVGKEEFIELLSKCFKQALEEYEQEKDFEEFYYRTYWLQMCMSIVKISSENFEDAKFAIYAEYDDHHDITDFII